ncbi:hypothetical protein PTI98_001046 [Pleurotus ostreatus]|uniref:PLC-like phosphodiesterase n=1 Tax=Pleurotus ostreatus (strain PC15) TaxID=1137138 RepID=A0A067P3N1_PLEO1|nr:hypothetical protein PTI98_001046 [Pleurotus ostreatus]KDQ31027.1 hypothetical protein PLEOSDRAFT_1036817 [Pleurotus ostreatus PC15]
MHCHARFYCSLALVASSLFSLAAQASSLSTRATVCNGHAELCERSYGSVSFVGAHDSYAVGATSNVFVNQDHDVTQQLNDGVRMLQLQVHNQGGALRLCHSICAIADSGLLQDYLSKVKSWMDSNPNEVVSILIVNIDNSPAPSFDLAYKAADLDGISFAPETPTLPASGWPTLGSMIDSGKRLVSFLDNGADPSIPYLIDEFTNIWETAFNLVNPDLFDCTVNRTKGDTSTQMFLINHFLNKLVAGLPAPDPDNADVTNAATGAGSLGAHVDTCRTVQGRPPTFLLVDFYEFGGGSVFQVAADINGVTYAPTTPIAQPVTANSSTSSSPSSGSGSGNGATAMPASNLMAMAISVLSAVTMGVVSVL